MAAIAVTATSVIADASASVMNVTAGSTVTAGQPVYKDETDGNKEYKPSLNDTAPHALCAGIALNGASDGQPLKILTAGDLTMTTTPAMTPGVAYYVGDAGGAISPVGDMTIGEFITVLGIAESATVLKVKINVSGVALTA